jgi:hypothetical protein
MTEPIRIANCSGFYGDRLSGAREMVEGGPIDVLTGDWLAELTMLILSPHPRQAPRRRLRPTFVTQMEQVMGTCLDRGIKVVSNAGGLDPAGCAEAVEPRSRRSSASHRPSPTSTATTCCPHHRPRRSRVPCARSTPAALGDVSRFVSPPTPTSGAGGSSRRSGAAPTSSSPAASPTRRSRAARRRGTTAGRATTGTRWPVRSSPVT